MVRYVVIGVIAFVLVIGAGAGTVWFMLNRVAGTSTEATQETAKGALGPKEKVLDIGKFVTNLADSESPRYIDVSFSVVVKEEKDARKIETNQPVIRDAVLTLLAAKTAEEVTGVGADALKASVLARLNEVLGEPIVQRILITSLVVQF